MTINRDNYEPFFLDFIEGNLNEKNIDQFLDFLEQNPDLKEELHSIGNFTLPAEQLVFAEKKQLYKSQGEETKTIENKLVAYLENDLENDERKTFESYLATQPELQKEYERFARTRLNHNSDIHFPNKRKLYRKATSVVIMNWVARAAAVVLLVWGINTFIQNENTPGAPKHNQEIAGLNPPKEIKPSSPEILKQKPENKLSINKTEKNSGIEQSKPIPAQFHKNMPSELVAEPALAERDLTNLSEIPVLAARLEPGQQETPLAFERSVRIRKVNEPTNVMGLDEYLAKRAEKVGKEGLLSVQRLARLGLGLASEISGDRISYNEKNGKIASVEFESKLLAFTIPLEKK